MVAGIGGCVCLASALRTARSAPARRVSALADQARTGATVDLLGRATDAAARQRFARHRVDVARFRHTAAQRMIDDPGLSLTDVQWGLGHAHLTTTELDAPPRGSRRAGAGAPPHPQAAPAPRPTRPRVTAPTCRTSCWAAVCVAEHIDPVVRLQRGARPSRRNSGEHDFVTPSLPTPAIARPTVWKGSQRSVGEILSAVDELEAGAVRKGAFTPDPGRSTVAQPAGRLPGRDLAAAVARLRCRHRGQGVDRSAERARWDE
jgi:hypothetical protein